MIRLIKFRQIDGFCGTDAPPGLYATTKDDQHVHIDALKLNDGEVLASKIHLDEDGFPTVWVLFAFPMYIRGLPEDVGTLLREGQR